MAGRVEIIERRRLRVENDREIDLATFVPEGGGADRPRRSRLPVARRSTRPSSSARAPASRFNVSRPKGGALTVEAKPQAPHAEVTRLHLDGATLHVEGT